MMDHDREIDLAEWRGNVTAKLDTIISAMDRGVTRIEAIERIQRSRPCEANTQALGVLTRLAWGALGTSITVAIGLAGFLAKHFISGKQ